jgi:hypothetical protein
MMKWTTSPFAFVLMISLAFAQAPHPIEGILKGQAGKLQACSHLYPSPFETEITVEFDIDNHRVIDLKSQAKPQTTPTPLVKCLEEIFRPLEFKEVSDTQITHVTYPVRFPASSASLAKKKSFKSTKKKHAKK